MSQPETFLETKRYALRMFSVVRILFVLGLALALGYGLGRIAPAEQPWTLADLRALDPADQPDPASDMTALFIRRTGLGCELRLDFVDLANPPVYDLLVQVGAQQLQISNRLPPPDGAQVQADPLLDTLTLSLPACLVRAGDPVRVTSRADSIGPLPFAGPAPAGTVSLGFVFYNIFSPAATPAQALRRWDGAHTGPRGERHGLHNLLNAAERYHIPLTLLDLETPAALSAIDVLGGTQQLRRMQSEGLLVLPAVIYADPAGVSLGLSEAASRGFGLAPAGWSYDTRHPADTLGMIEPIDPGDGGLSVDTRRILLNAGSSGRPALLLGGDFQKTTWGTPDYITPAMAWLAARPYFRFSAGAALRSTAVQPLVPPGEVQRSAFEARFVLAVADPLLAANYAGVADAIEAASVWAQKPTAGAACARLCILSSQRFYAVLDPHGARLVFLFAGPAQLIGPTAQFFVGFSDRSEWDFSKGQGADPQQVMGAFADVDDAFRPYQAQPLDPQTIRFMAAGGRVKTYRLLETGLQAELSGPVETQIPLVVNPQARYQAGWAGRYIARRSPSGLEWGPQGGPLVSIQISGASDLALSTVFDAGELLTAPEDPNLEYPPGVFLPFPMAMARFSSATGVVVTLGTSEK